MIECTDAREKELLLTPILNEITLQLFLSNLDISKTLIVSKSDK